MGRLDGKIALIVGGGADGPPNPGEELSIGNGRATAILCAREGALVMVADRTRQLALETASAIRSEGNQADAVEADVSQEDDCRRAVEESVRRFGALQLLVNNVGIAIGRSLLNTTTDEFNRMYQVNLRSHFLMMKYAVPEIVKGGGGAIVNVSSVAALLSGSGIAYEATKAALLGLSRSVAVRYARDKVRVNTILPGLINFDGAPGNRRPGGARSATNTDGPAGNAMGDCQGRRLPVVRRRVVYHRHPTDRRRRHHRR